MADNSLVVPVILVTGSLHFAEIRKDGKVQDVINFLLETEGAKAEILEDLKESGWALQKIRVEQSGRTWEEDELMALGDGWYFVITSLST